MLFSAAILSLLGLAAALPSESSIAERAVPVNPPRNLAYVQTFRRVDGGNFSMLPLIQKPTQLTHLYISSLHINSDPKGMNINDNRPNDTIWNTMWSEVKQLQKSGVKVMYMMGGAAPGSYPRLCSGPSRTVINESYYMPLYYELKYRKLDGIDLDIEEKVSINCPYALLQRLNKDFGSNFILTMSPVASELQPSGYGLGGFSYKTLDYYARNSAKPNGKIVNWFNAQFYNGWGDAGTPNGYNAIVQNGYSADRVVLGTLTSQFNGGSGWKNITTIQKTVATLRANYGTKFGGLNAWEYWDAGRSDKLTEPYKWIGAIGNSLFLTKNVFTKRQSAAVSQDFNGTITKATSPWPQLTDRLLKLNGGFQRLATIQALNQTNGDITRALGILNAGNLLSGLSKVPSIPGLPI
ncbi:putative glycoside hydrolase family 18, catalytic domain, glycosyl hydrolase family 18 (GH18) active [Septoria linicola]|nr:putative glycoside hydrolase family 18, catalytic domain, glycosyl hydrolase family 18 (GH18) active [Septoria linicola]